MLEAIARYVWKDPLLLTLVSLNVIPFVLLTVYLSIRTLCEMGQEDKFPPPQQAQQPREPSADAILFRQIVQSARARRAAGSAAGSTLFTMRDETSPRESVSPESVELLQTGSNGDSSSIITMPNRAS
eukprot:TRINITY_DN2947_c0_g2_i1.p1 TRINITY_DN2947_c0_g2~~TRINITY_DN2947_c0_g2_i1.p1  ORF type:complete len:128 (+),score=12.59 TRINITY_DN2947_c0_g2_i1:193-576(+)